MIIVARKSGYSRLEEDMREAEELKKRQEEERRRQEAERRRREEAERRERERQRQLAEAQSQKRGYELKKNECEKQYANNENKIIRLKAAKKSLENIKEKLTSRKITLQTFVEAGDTYGDWYGDKLVDVQDILTIDVPAEYTSYINHVESILDTICNEITRLQHENYELNGVIGQLRSWINSLINKIHALGN